MKLRQFFAQRISVPGLAGVLAILLSSSLARSEDTLHILIWEDFIAPELLEAWTRETGSAVKLAYFDSDEERDSIIAERKARFDVVVVDGLSSLVFGERDLFADIAEADVPNIRHIDSKFSGLCRDGTGVPYLWGTVGLVYRTDKLDAPASWSDLMKPAASVSGHVGMIDDYADTFIPPLALLGENINTNDPKILKTAFEMLKAQLPAVLTYEYAVTFLQTELGKDLYLAMAYSGDQRVLNEYSASTNWAYVVPKEGTVTWVDCMAIPQNSEAPALAKRFLNFINEPENAALNAEALGIATANLAAMDFIPEKLRSDPSIYPSSGFKGTRELQGYRGISRSSINLRNRITRALVKLHESQ